MATTTDTPPREDVTTAPEGPGRRHKRDCFGTHRGFLTWGAVLAASAAAVALAVVTLTGGDDTTPVTGAPSGLVERGSVRSIEGSVEESSGRVDRLAPGAPSGLVERGSIRSIEGSVEDRSGS